MESKSKNSVTRLLDAAKHVLQEADSPLTARQIAELIEKDSVLKKYLTGKTPHKTVQARLSIDILENDLRSQFYRFSPATFGLRSKLDDEHYDHAYKVTRPWARRVKSLSDEYIAVLRKSDIDFFSQDGFYGVEDFPYEILKLLPVFYVPRREAEESDHLWQLVSYGAIVSPESILVYEKGKYTSDRGEFIGNLSIGFGGHCSAEDRTMFDNDPIGLMDNLRREIGEELFLVRKSLWSSIQEIEFQGFLVDTSTQNGRRHLGLASKITLNCEIQLSSGKLGIKNLQWMRAGGFSNCFHKLEIWSQYYLKAQYSKTM